LKETENLLELHGQPLSLYYVYSMQILNFGFFSFHAIGGLVGGWRIFFVFL